MSMDIREMLDIRCLTYVHGNVGHSSRMVNCNVSILLHPDISISLYPDIIISFLQLPKFLVEPFSLFIF